VAANRRPTNKINCQQKFEMNINVKAGTAAKFVAEKSTRAKTEIEF